MRKPFGFTLVELLVVMAIILLLAMISLPMLFKAKEAQLLSNATAEIEYLKSALEQYRTDFGDYPPSSLINFDTADTPDIGNVAVDLIPKDHGRIENEGNKAMVACMATTRGNGPYLKSYVRNDVERVKVSEVHVPADFADNDPTGWVFVDDDLPRRYRELFDPWGTPYIYLHNRDYDLDPPPVYSMEGLKDGFDDQWEMPSKVKGRKDDDGVYYGTYSFQIWSCGPNRINDNGGEDDITSWQGQ